MSVHKYEIWDGFIVLAALAAMFGIPCGILYCGIHYREMGKCEDKCHPYASRFVSNECECANDAGHWAPQKKELETTDGKVGDGR